MRMKNGDNDNGNISRRDFGKLAAKTAVTVGALPLIGKIASAAETVAGTAAAGAASVAGAADSAKSARVVLVLSKTPIPKGDEATAVFRAMLDEGLKAIADGKTPEEFMRGKFSADDRVAIKVNNFGFKGHRGPQLAQAICERLQSAGVIPENVVVYENSDGMLKDARYKINHDGPGFRCYGNDYTGHMEKTIKTGITEARYTKILEKCTALINMPSLKAHNMAGITICMKNHYGSVDNPRQFHGESGECDPHIANINTADIIKNKTRLAVCDATKVLFAGGPEWLGQYTADFNGILVSTDVVALDAIGNKIIKKFRKDSGLKQLPWNPEPKQLKTAQKNGIGVADLTKIDFVEIKV